MRELSESRKARLLAVKIRSEFPPTPQCKLMFSVIEVALRDLTAEAAIVRSSARRYLSGEMLHAQVCDVDPDWIKRLMNDVGLDLTGQ